MKKAFIQLLTTSIILLFTSQVMAADLMQVYQQATQSDPTFRAARASMMANEEAVPQARALLLPTISGTASNAHNIRKNFKARSFESTADTTFKYHSRSYGFELSQPLINIASWMTLMQAKAQVKQAVATYAAAEQDLMTRVASAYFQILEDKDILRFTEAEKRANAQQLSQAQQRFKVGLDAITSVYDAQAAYDSTVADEIAARNSLKNSREALRAITGVLYPHLAGLKGQVPLMKPKPENVEDWVVSARDNNLQLKAQHYATEAAEENIKVQFAGHIPSVNLVADYTRAEHGDNGAGSSDNASTTAGLELALPLFQGGAVTSLTRQARYEYVQARDTEEQVYRDTVDQTRQRYNSIISGISKIKADKRAIVSRESSLKSSEAAFKVGTRTIVDVLLAQTILFETQQQYAQDQYALINDILELKRAAGTLSTQSLEEINSWLEHKK